MSVMAILRQGPKRGGLIVDVELKEIAASIVQHCRCSILVLGKLRIELHNWMGALVSASLPFLGLIGTKWNVQSFARTQPVKY